MLHFLGVEKSLLCESPDADGKAALGVPRPVALGVSCCKTALVCSINPVVYLAWTFCSG
jgi:hypothetical protein